ncbi:hypothetical protein [Anaeroselena agilis]|uniref:Uncharacterized protein n=1 Tax=Anaeroselena agilis TaxID=3063788 RepID=A0ABU3NY84_9FIRM|nr:hypothetical protein [Selenomonadales bacterium 4137-cl]
MNGSLPGLCASPFGLLILWLVLFIVLADVSCPIFHACYACTPFYGRKGCGRGTDWKSRD